MKIFKLFSCCIPVKGAVRSVICDLQRNDFIFIPEGLYEILTLHKNKSELSIKECYEKDTHIIIDGYFKFLLDNEYGFWCDSNVIQNFPDIDLTFETPELINNAIIDIGDEMVLNYNKILNELNELKCKFIEIRSYSYQNIRTFVEFFLKYTNDKIFRNIKIYLKYYPRIVQDIDELNILSKYSTISDIIIHSSPRNEMINGNLYLQKEELNSQNDCGKICIENFVSNISTFSEAQNYNTCLNRKISIDSLGQIKNCPSFIKNYGNIENVSLIDVLNNKLFKSFWEINKSLIASCKDCEFRYICTDCRAYVKNIYDKPVKCNYNPYDATWN